MTLLYHRVNSFSSDPWELCVSPQHFAEQLQVIRAMSPRPRLTFDDGYADNFLFMLPLLEKYDLAAECFIVSGGIGRRTEMWWDALDLLYPEPEMYEREFHRMRLLPYDEQEVRLDSLFEQCNLSREARPERRMMTSDELIRLAASPLVSIGAHTVTHPVLSQLTDTQQEEEIRGSKEWLERLLDQSVDAFSYPNGMNVDYTEKTVQLIRESGFKCAYSAFQHARLDPFQSPRLMIRDWNGEQFARALSGQAAIALT